MVSFCGIRLFSISILWDEGWGLAKFLNSSGSLGVGS